MSMKLLNKKYSIALNQNLLLPPAKKSCNVKKIFELTRFVFYTKIKNYLIFNINQSLQKF